MDADQYGPQSWRPAAATTTTPPWLGSLWTTVEERDGIYLPRWTGNYQIGMANEPDHVAAVSALADGCGGAADVYPVTDYNTFNHAPFRAAAKEFSALAFRWMMTGQSTDLSTAIAFIVAQAAYNGWNAWPTGPGYRDAGHAAGASHGIAALTFGYSIIRRELAEADRTTVDAYLADYAALIKVERDGLMNNWLTNWNTATDPAQYIWSVTDTGWQADAPDGTVPYVGGPALKSAHNHFGNNRWASMHRAVAMVGVVLNDNTMKELAAKWVRGHLAFGWFNEGVSYDWVRGQADGSLAYPALALANTITIADLLLRDGYLNLYDYTTTAGVEGSASAAFANGNYTAKSLDWAIYEMGRHWNGTYSRAGTGGPTMGSYTRGEHVRLSLGNVYYRDSGLPRSLYLSDGSNGVPTMPAAQLNDIWTLDKEAAPSWVIITADREAGTYWPYPAGM